MEKSIYDTYVDACQFVLNGRRQNLCWLMSHCSLERSDEWRDKQFRKIENSIDNYVVEFALVQREAVKIEG